MNEIIMTSVVWVAIGAMWTYYSDKKAYNEGMIDAIVLHNRGKLTYKVYEDDNGISMIEMRVIPDEK
jgi:hypothetical protein